MPLAEQSVPIVVAEEVMRGQLSTIRRARQGSAVSHWSRPTITFRKHLAFFGISSFFLTRLWRRRRFKLGERRRFGWELKICGSRPFASHRGATLVTRNARDYSQIPGLILDVWN